jgi:hypothetical protein
MRKRSMVVSWRYGAMLWILLAGALYAQSPVLWWEPPIKGATAFAAAIGDVNGDGFPDAAWVQILDSGYILLNDGTGHFAPHPTASLLPPAVDAALGDLNGNGHLDLLLGMNLGQCQVWTNNGTGEFFFTGQFIGPFATRRSVALADVNGNGFLDAVLPSDDATKPSEVWLNNGLGVFSFSQTVGSNWNRHVAIGDINGSGFPDLVFAANFDNTVWTNDGTGSFSNTGQTVGSGSGSGSYKIALGDLNGNGHLDVFVANAGTSSTRTNEVWINNGAGVFTNSHALLDNASSLSVALVDVDADGDLDAVEGNAVGQANSIWLNNGSAVFTRAPVSLGASEAFDIEPADLDGDGDTDYFISVNGTPSEVWLRIPFAQGGPVVDSGQRLGGYAITDVVPGDFNGNGHLDVAFSSEFAVGLLTNNGTGSFTPTAQMFYYDAVVSAVEALDFNDDGHLDRVIGLDQSFDTNGYNRILLNDGTGLFTAGPTLPVARATRSLAVADLTGNGYPDIVEGNRTTAPLPSLNPTNRVHINHGGGVWTSFDAFGGGWTDAVAIGDLNGDGLPDVVVGNKDVASTLWLNTGSTQFVDSGQAFMTNVQDLVLADFNGNGTLDIFMAASPRSVLYTNDGSGVFSVSSSNFLTTAFFMQTGAVDTDGDGSMDIWVGQGGVGATPDRLYLNDGTGVFASFITVSNANLNTALAIGDFTGNGKNDVFSAGDRGDSQLWTRETLLNAVEVYAASFGLDGADLLPFADPDEDDIPNIMEYAYNMNPNLADVSFVTNPATATQGLPYLYVAITNQQPHFVAHTIRLVNPVEVDYHLDAAPTLVFTGAVPTAVSTIPLDATYERATYTYPVPGDSTNHFGRFRIEYLP